MINNRFNRRIRLHVIGREHDFFAVVQPGFEETAKRELQSLGISSITGTREGGVGFRGKLPACYIVNLRSRTVSRVLMRLISFRAGNFDLFREKVRALPWELHIAAGVSIEFRVTSSGSRLYHTDRIEEECRRGIKERLEEQGVQAGGSDGAAVQRIYVRLENNRCTVSLDSTGELLYRRSEKILVSAAPIRETLASLILLEAGIEEYDVLLDPMCGSGTFSIEGAGIMLKKAPGENRDFSFRNWPGYSEAAFSHMIKKLREGQPQRAAAGEPFIIASDIDGSAVDITRKNLVNAGLDWAVDLRQRDFLKEPVTIPTGRRCLIVLNPPYGPRLGRDSDRSYRVLGMRIREWYAGCGYAIITPSVEHEKILSLHYDRKILFKNGGIDVAVIIRHVGR